MVAHGDPPPIRAHAHAVGDVEVFLEQDLTVSDRTTRVAVQQMPGDGMSVVVADQDLTPIVPDVADGHRTGRIHEGRPVRRPPCDREHFEGPHVPVPRRQLEESDVTSPARDDHGIVVEEVHPMRPLQSR